MIIFVYFTQLHKYLLKEKKLAKYFLLDINLWILICINFTNNTFFRPDLFNYFSLNIFITIFVIDNKTHFNEEIKKKHRKRVFQNEKRL